MRTVVTMKNHCVAKVEKMAAAAAAAAAGGGKAGGYNPLVPNPASGGFIGDIHVGKFDDLLNVYDPKVTRRFIASPRTISFSFD